MNKFLMFFILLFSINVHAIGLDESTGECKNAIELVNSIGKFSENNLGADSYKSCGFMLMKEDPNLIIALAPIATPEIVMHYSDIIQAFGGNAELMSEHMNSRSVLMAWILDLAQYSKFFGIIFFLLAAWGLIHYRNSAPSVILKIIFVVLVAVGISKFDKVYTLINIHYVGATNQILWNAADHKQIERIGEDPISNLVPAIQKNSTTMSQLFHYVELINVVSNNEAFDNLWGKDIEIDTTYNKWGFDIKNPSITEALDYINECSYTDYAVVDNEVSLHLKNLNFSSIVTEVEFNSGGETKNYNCHPSHYGNSVVLAKLIFNTPNLIKNFMLSNFSEYMGTDLTLKDEFETIGNKIIGTLMLEIEKAEDTAATNPEIISEQLQMSQDAAEESRLTGVDYTKTDSYLELVEMHKLKMGDIFDYKEIEGITNIANIAYRGISLNHYNGAEWFSLSGDKDSIISEKRMMGYHVLQPYLRTTISYELESQCAKTNGAGFQTRKEFATRFNNMIAESDSIKFKNAGSFGLKSDTHCYRFNDDGSIIAGGDYGTVDELDEMISDRLRSIDIYQAARNQAGLDLILGDEELDKSLQLKALNSLSPTFTDAMKSYTVLTDSKQELSGALSTLQDAMAYESLVNYNTNLPQYYFNFKKFHTNGKSKTLEADAESRELQKYDLSDFFEINSLSFVEDARALQENAEGSIAKMTRNECPYYDSNGKCRANLLMLNMSSFSHTYELTKVLMMYEKGVGLGSGVCDVVDKGFENTLGGVFGKVRYVTPIGVTCAVLNLANAGNEIFIKAIEVLAAIATGFSFVMSLVPVLLDLLRMYAPFLLMFVPAVLITVTFWIEVIFGSTRFILFSQHTEKDFLEAIDFPQTSRACQSVVVSLGGSLFIYFMITSLLTSEMIGGATYDNIWSGYDKAIIESISRSFITVFVVGIQIWQIAIPLSRRVWNQIMEITNTKGQNFDSDFENFAKSLMLGVGMGAVAQFKAINNGMDKSLNNLATPKEDDSKNTPPTSPADKEAQANKQTVDSDEDEKDDDVNVGDVDSKETSSSDKEDDDKHYPESRNYEVEGSPVVSKDNTQADIESKAKEAIEKIDKELDSKKE